MGKIKSSVSEEPTSAFTSMIDIVFLLLIFFILQPFKEPEMRLEANLPQNSSSSKDTPDMERPPEDIKIRILSVGADSSNAKFVVDGQLLGMATEASSDEIGQKLSSALRRRSHGLTDTPVAILPDARVHFMHVLQALDACYSTRMQNVKFGFGN